MTTEPPPPGTQGAPGTEPRNGALSTGPPGTAMPPPSLPPLNTSSAPGTQLPAKPANGAADDETPATAGGTIRRAAPEPNKRALYVGGLDQRVTEDVLKQIFETSGHVQSVKVIPDKNVRAFLH